MLLCGTAIGAAARSTAPWSTSIKSGEDDMRSSAFLALAFTNPDDGSSAGSIARFYGRSTARVRANSVHCRRRCFAARPSGECVQRQRRWRLAAYIQCVLALCRLPARSLCWDSAGGMRWYSHQHSYSERCEATSHLRCATSTTSPYIPSIAQGWMAKQATVDRYAGAVMRSGHGRGPWSSLVWSASSSNHTHMTA